MDERSIDQWPIEEVTVDKLRGSCSEAVSLDQLAMPLTELDNSLRGGR